MSATHTAMSEEESTPDTESPSDEEPCPELLSLYQLIHEAKLRAQLIHRAAEDLATDLTDEAASYAIVDSVKQLYTQEKRKQTEERIRLFADSFLTEVVRDIVKDVASREVTRAFHDKHASDFRRKVVETSKHVSDQVIAAAVDHAIREAATRAWESWQRKRAQEEQRRQQLERKYFTRWLSKYRQLKRFKLLKHSFPASAIESLSLHHVTEDLRCSKKRTPLRSSSSQPSLKVKKQKVHQKSLPPASMQLRRSPRVANNTLALCRERIRLESDKSPSSRVQLLNCKLEEEKEKGLRDQQLVTTVTQAFVHTEDFYE